MICSGTSQNLGTLSGGDWFILRIITTDTETELLEVRYGDRGFHGVCGHPPLGASNSSPLRKLPEDVSRGFLALHDVGAGN